MASLLEDIVSDYFIFHNNIRAGLVSVGVNSWYIASTTSIIGGVLTPGRYQRENFVRHLASFLTLSALAIASPVIAQEKTPANAYEFIRSNMSNGTWEGFAEYCDDDGCVIEDTPIRGVIYEENSYCVIRVSMQGDRILYRTLDLRKAFSISLDFDRRKIVFQGPVRTTNGEIRSDWWAWGPSVDITHRVKDAFNYLASICGPKGPW